MPMLSIVSFQTSGFGKAESDCLNCLFFISYAVSEAPALFQFFQL